MALKDRKIIHYWANHGDRTNYTFCEEELYLNDKGELILFEGQYYMADDGGWQENRKRVSKGEAKEWLLLRAPKKAYAIIRELNIPVSDKDPFPETSELIGSRTYEDEYGNYNSEKLYKTKGGIFFLFDPDGMYFVGMGGKRYEMLTAAEAAKWQKAHGE